MTMLSTLLALWSSAPALATEFPLVPLGATWSYLDNGVDPGPEWIQPDFDDSAWASGPAPLGYGIADADTIVSYGPDPLNKYVTTWFRADVTVTGAADLTGLVVSLRADDGAVVYLNGVEVYRKNLPAGPITSSTYAITNLIGAAGSQVQRIAVDTSQLVEGDNTVAVEVHQQSATNIDLALDLALNGYDGATAITRGPYLQRTTDDGTILRWRTLGPSDSAVWYGAAPGALDQEALEPDLTLDHAVELTGLGPSTTWAYAVGSAAEGALAGDDLDHVFATHPPAGDAAPLRIWVLGDAGTADPEQEDVRDAFYTYNGDESPDLVLMLGDNAYGSGTDAEYQEAVFDIYPSTLRQVAFWSTIGNHDGYSSTSLTQTGPYFDLFSFPTAGEVGGEPSGTEAYYSFDVGRVHFVSLDSNGSDRLVGGAQMLWLEADLAATDADWVIAFWHHPPYSKGSHDSDTELQLVQMRENALPILESYGVDLVLAGHSHSYERSYLIDGHYETSDLLDPAMIRDDSDGSRDDGFAYRKPTDGLGANEGAIYAVAGSSGKVDGGDFDHPIMQVSLEELGSMVIDIDGDTLDAVFLMDDGTVGDQFSIDKGVTAIVSLEGPREGTIGESLEWTALALHPDGTEVASYDWDFGDGATGTGATVAHTYPTAGLWTVQLTVPDLAGADVVRTIDVQVDDGAPAVVTFVVPTADEGELVALSAFATDVGGSAITYTWDLGDGTVLEGADIDHVWEDDGAYTVTLTAADDEGESTVVEALATITNADPVILSATAGTGAEGDPIPLDAVALDPGVLDVLVYSWDLGTGAAPLVGASVDALLPSGDNLIVLTVSDGDGGAARAELVVGVTEAEPTVLSTSVVQWTEEGRETPFSVVAVDPGGDPLTIRWDMGDGAVLDGAAVSHAWAEDGAYVVSLTVDDDDGGYGDIGESWEVTVANAAPVVSVTVSGDLFEGGVATLAATAVDPGVDDEVTVSWDIGDNPLDGAVVTWVWPGSGPRTVTAYGVDQEGAIGSASLTVDVANLPPVFGDEPPAEARVGEVWTWDPQIVDPGGDTVKLRLSSESPGAEVDGDGIVTWTPTSAERGNLGFALTATDADGAETVKTWSVHVRGGGVGCAHTGSGWGRGGVAALLAVALARRRRG